MARNRRRGAAKVKPAAEIDFSNREQAREWFRHQSREVCIALAVRSALRVLPLIDRLHDRSDFAPRVALPVLRACVVAWAIAKYPSQRNHLRSYAAIAGPAYVDVRVDPHADPYLGANVALAYAAAAYAVDVAATGASAHSYTYGPAAARAVRADAVAIEQGRPVAEIVAALLWPGEMPKEIVKAWDRQRAWMLEDQANSWHPWVEWYERVRDGRPSFGEAFDLAVASLTDEEWNEEPRPAAVNHRIAALLAKHTGPEPIPPQGPGPHFTLGPDLRIVLAPPAEIDANGNNLTRIRQLLPVVRQAATDLAGHLNPNTQPEISRTLNAYRAAISGELETIAWGVVFGLGVQMANTASIARRQIEDYLQPPLEDAAHEALDSLLTLHGPLILASAEGRELLSLADEYRLTPEQRATLRADAQLVLNHLKAAPHAVDAAATNAVEAAAEAAGEGPHPDRGITYWLGTTGNIAAILVPAAVLAAVGGAASTSFGAAIGSIAGAAAGAVGTAALRESERVKLAAKALGLGYDRLLERGDQGMIDGLRRLAPFRHLVITLEEPLRRYAETAQSRWMLRYIDFIVRNDGDSK